MANTMRGSLVTPSPHPSRGGNPYPDAVRQQVLIMHFNGEDLSDNKSNPNAHWLVPLREAKTFPCAKTCKKWIDQYESDGHVNPKTPTGNKESRREIQGEDLVNLALFRRGSVSAQMRDFARSRPMSTIRTQIIFLTPTLKLIVQRNGLG
jgi:hypothetical protein